MSASCGDAAPAPACRAPETAMHFSLAGDVHACCQNGADSYGNVAVSSLRQIWDGAARRRMADGLRSGRYPGGCEGCEIEHALGNRESTPAADFDRYAGPSPSWPRHLEFTLSNRCNLACIQCNGDNSSTIRAQREGRPPTRMAYTDRFFEQLPPFLEHAEVVSFLGGEPFLAPEAKRVWEMLLGLAQRPRVSVTTNATIWNANVERLVRGLRMDLAVSIDAMTAGTFEAIRIGADHARVLEIRDRMLAAVRDHGGHFQLNFCLMPANWHELGAFLAEADALGVDVKVIPVHAPREHSLLALPEADLAEVAERLAAEGSLLRASLGRNRAAWDDALRLVGDQLEHVRSGVGRGLLAATIRNDRRNASEALIDDAEADLRAWSGRELVEVGIERNRVRAVRAPHWARGLYAEEWIDDGIDAIGHAVATRVGRVEFSELEDRSEGAGLLLVNESVLTAAGARFHFRTAYAPRLGRMLIASPDLAL